MTIARKLYVGFGSVVGVLVALLLADIMVILREQAARKQAETAMVSMQQVDGIRRMVMQSRLSLQDYLLSGDSRHRDGLTEQIAELSGLLASARAGATGDLKDVLARMEANERRWMAGFAVPLVAIRQQVDDGDDTVASLQIKYAQRDPNSWIQASTTILDEAGAAIQTSLQEASGAAAKAFSVGTTVNMSFTVVAVLLCLGIGYRSAMSISGPVAATVEVLRNIAEGEGDLTRRVSQGTGDELGEMGKWFNLFMVKLERIVSQVADSTYGVAGSSQKLSAVSNEMSSSAEATSAQAQVVAASAEQVTRNLQTVAAATEEMTASISEIAKNATAAAGVAARAVDRARAANATMSQLGESSAAIGEVVKVINSVAQQTKLLALNATIEAARAGVAGKGFAVVANEVKDLANETAKATNQINDRIQAIRTGSDAAVDLIAEITKTIGEMHDISATIASAVEEQTATTKEIARNVTEAAIGESHVTENIGSVAQAAKLTASGAHSTQTAAGELAGMAAQLRDVVGVFKYSKVNSAQKAAA